MEHVTGKRYPVNAKDYKLYEEIGDGVSATVYRAVCIPLDENVAIKVLDLEKCNNDLDGIRREVQTMRVIDHPNVLRAHCSFTAGRKLWVVMPYMAAGSCLHIMKSAFPDGFEEPVIATLLREVLKALVYLHAHGHIHRDVKSGNILIDSNGDVKLGDFGVSACMFDTGDRQRSRNTFVGTPCWMAPEVMQQLHGYDFKADVWSFGITALELAHGHAPFSKYPPMKVLLMTLQNAPPGLDYERDKKFSKSFKEMVATCLVKDPKKRPSSEKLLKHHFFKHGRSNDYLVHTILDGLPPLGDRYKMLKAKEADLLAQNKSLYENEHLSQQEYIRGISAWNFNLEDLRNQAALIQDDGNIDVEDPGESEKQKERSNEVLFQTENPSPERSIYAQDTTGHKDAFSDDHDLESSLASFPVQPLQALKGCFDIREDTDAKGSSRMESDELLRQSFFKMDGQKREKLENEDMGQGSYWPRLGTDQKNFFSGSLVLDNAPKKVGDGDRDLAQPKSQPERNYSGPLLYRQKRDGINTNLGDDASEGPMVQRKGRFQVTSADLSPKGPSNCMFGPASGSSTGTPTSNFAAGSVLPSLQCILQHNAMQREEIMKLIKYTEQISGRYTDSAEASTEDLLQMTPASGRERELQSQIINLQRSIGTLAEELQRQKSKNDQLERQLNAFVNKEENMKENKS